MRKHLLNFAFTLCCTTLSGGCQTNEVAKATAPEIETRECTPQELKMIKDISDIVKIIGNNISSVEPDSPDVTPEILQPEKTNFVCTDQGPTINCEPTQPRVCTVNPREMARKPIETNVGNFAGAQIDNDKRTTTETRYKDITQMAIKKIEPN